MTELRYNPLLQDWTMVASKRQNRPHLPADQCPFCPGSGKVPQAYDVLAYNNDFPALSNNPPEPDVSGSELYPVEKAYGKCEVILYSSDHTSSMSSLSESHLRLVVDLWATRFAELAKDEKHKYIFIFENRGKEVGVTMPHPHGQIYAYPYIPQKLRVELDSSLKHYATTGHCLVCDIEQEEKMAAQRVIYESSHFLCFIPFFTDYPYGVFIVSKAHKQTLLEFTKEERSDLAHVLKRVTAGMDTLFDREFPYMMAMHQAPVNGPDVSQHYHFHIEFYPPLREANRIKFLASSESGAWAPCNPTAVEETAVLLRNAVIEAKDRDQARERG